MNDRNETTRWGPTALLHGGAIGDCVLALRVAAALRHAGASSVTLLGRAHHAEIAPFSPDVDDVLDLDAGGFHTLFSDDATLPPAVAGRFAAFDLAVNMLGDDDGRVAAALRRAGVARVVNIDPAPQAGGNEHITDQWLGRLRDAGVDVSAGAARLIVDEADRDEMRRRLCDQLGAASGSIALLHPGSGSMAKCWPVEDWAALASELDRRGWGVGYLLGPAEQERFSAAKLRTLAASAPVLSPGSLAECVRRLACADLYAGNDGGITHLAAATGTRTLAVFGPTDPNVWRPYAEAVCVARTSAGWPSAAEAVGRLSAAAWL